MKSTTVTFICGHSVDVPVTIKRGDTYEAWLVWREQGSCPDCYKAARYAESKRLAAEAGLTELKGSDAQIGWAESLRLDARVEINRTMAENAAAERPFYDVEYLEIAGGAVLAKEEARWWIENRETNPRFFILKHYEEMRRARL